MSINKKNVPLEWNEDLHIGVEAIDQDHKQLISWINALGQFQASDQTGDRPGDREDLGTLLRFLAAYTAFHFEREEAIMRAVRYKGYENHKRAHGSFAANIKRTIAHWEESGNNAGVAPLYEFLKLWITNHIRREDTRLKELLKGQDEKINKMLKNEDFSTFGNFKAGGS